MKMKLWLNHSIECNLCFCRLARFLETAGSVLNYFQNFLGRIEIMGSSHKIERVYFEILEDNIEQWEKPQIKVMPKVKLQNANLLKSLSYNCRNPNEHFSTQS